MGSFDPNTGHWLYSCSQQYDLFQALGACSKTWPISSCALHLTVLDLDTT